MEANPNISAAICATRWRLVRRAGHYSAARPAPISFARRPRARASRGDKICSAAAAPCCRRPNSTLAGSAGAGNMVAPNISGPARYNNDIWHGRRPAISGGRQLKGLAEVRDAPIRRSQSPEAARQQIRA